MDTRPLTGNRDRDKGWRQNDGGNWVPSVHDRRRLAVAEMMMIAQVTGSPALPPEMVMAALADHSTGADDLMAMAENFVRWQRSLGN